MNHDATHWADYKVAKCSKRCYQARLTQDLRGSGYAFPTSWAHFEGTQYCVKTKKTAESGNSHTVNKK